jgi:hypothetical protein
MPTFRSQHTTLMPAGLSGSQVTPEAVNVHADTPICKSRIQTTWRVDEIGRCDRQHPVGRTTARNTMIWL